MADNDQTASPAPGSPGSEEPPAQAPGGDAPASGAPGADPPAGQELRPGAGAPIVAGPPRSVRPPIRAGRLNAVLGFTGVLSILAIIAAVVIVLVIIIRLIRG